MKQRKELKNQREARGLSQEQLAEAVGLSISQVSRFESGTREPRISEAVSLAKALNAEVVDLFPELKPKPSQGSGTNFNALLGAVEGAFEMLACDRDQAAALLKLVFSISQEQPTPSAGPDFHRVLAEREVRKFLQPMRVQRHDA